ncbi:hypothetical protein [Nocardioides aequoreus]|uniref:hypothetical protein n=1 Tax=Nocardioides aequoreus TaxID=397278 RepID=UPI0012F64570|nr:hypothetical protein [Nocardioides aequoreus]
MGMLVAADYGYLMRVSVGLPVRPVDVADVVTVVAACLVPAIAAPQLWAIERMQRRPLVRIVSAVLVPSLVALTSAAELMLQQLGLVPLAPGLAAACLANGLFFGSVSILVGLRQRRHIGPMVGIGAYLLGVLSQALTLQIPLPAAQAASGLILVLSLLIFLIATVSLGLTMGRIAPASRDFD